jgi:hypothetical protein
MVLLASEFDKSKYLNAVDDLKGGERKFKIKEVTAEDVGKETKLVVWFTNDKKGLVLNKTNNRVLRKEYGDDVEGWKGKIIAVFAMDVLFQGKLTPGLRVRILPPKQPGAKPASTTFMSRSAETQPLGNGGSAAAKSANNKKPVNTKNPPARDELDEVIENQPPPQESSDDDLNDDVDF